MKYIIETPDKWKGPGHCWFCRLKKCAGPKFCCIANAKEVVECNIGDTIIDLKNDGTYSIDDKPGILYSVIKDK